MGFVMHVLTSLPDLRLPMGIPEPLAALIVSRVFGTLCAMRIC